MPELPEVEVTRRCMTAALEGRVVRALRVYEPRLRWPVPRTLGATLVGRSLQRIDRRVPSRDGSIFGNKDKYGRFSGRNFKIGCAIEYRSGWG